MSNLDDELRETIAIKYPNLDPIGVIWQVNDIVNRINDCHERIREINRNKNTEVNNVLLELQRLQSNCPHFLTGYSWNPEGGDTYCKHCRAIL